MPVTSSFRNELSRIQERMSRNKRRQKRIDAHRRKHPETVEALLNSAAAKRERRLHRNRLASTWQKAWQPHPSHDKPTYEEVRHRQLNEIPVHRKVSV